MQYNLYNTDRRKRNRQCAFEICCKHITLIGEVSGSILDTREGLQFSCLDLEQKCCRFSFNSKNNQILDKNKLQRKRKYAKKKVL